MRDSLVGRISTADVPREARVEFWNRVVAETFASLVIDPLDPDAFQAEMVRAAIGDITLMSANSAAAHVSHSGDPMRTARPPRYFDLHFQLAGSSLNSQGGRETELEAGEFTLCDASQPYDVRFTAANHMLCLKMPAEALAARLGDPDRLVCQRMGSERGGGAMLAGFLRAVWSQLDQGVLEPGWADTVSDVIFDLASLAYRPLQEEGRADTLRASRRSQARELIQARLCDPGLGVGVIAEALGVTPRYVQLLFAEAGATPSAYILERRLELAAERLRGQVGRGGVTQVALGVGFNDLTHFGRAFRRRFGVSPSDYAAGARALRWSADAPRAEDSLAF